MIMPISEIADKFSILRLKSERTDLDVIAEIALYRSAFDQYHNIDTFVDSLYNINGMIWNLESDLRSGKEGKLGLEEIGRRAIEIRNLNNTRVAIKNEIVNKFNQGFVETKVDHASE